MAAAPAVTRMPVASRLNSTSTDSKPIGWQCGIRSGVRLAPSKAAARAVANTSGLGVSPDCTRLSVAGSRRKKPSALASLKVVIFAPTSNTSASYTRHGEAFRHRLPVKSVPGGFTQDRVLDRSFQHRVALARPQKGPQIKALGMGHA